MEDNVIVHVLLLFSESWSYWKKRCEQRFENLRVCSSKMIISIVIILAIFTPYFWMVLWAIH